MEQEPAGDRKFSFKQFLVAAVVVFFITVVGCALFTVITGPEEIDQPDPDPEVIIQEPADDDAIAD